MHPFGEVLFSTIEPYFVHLTSLCLCLLLSHRPEVWFKEQSMKSSFTCSQTEQRKQQNMLFFVFKWHSAAPLSENVKFSRTSRAFPGHLTFSSFSMTVKLVKHFPVFPGHMGTLNGTWEEKNTVIISSWNTNCFLFLLTLSSDLFIFIYF